MQAILVRTYALGPGDIVLHGPMGTQLPHGKGHQQPPLFGPLCCRTIAHLSNYSAELLLQVFVQNFVALTDGYSFCRLQLSFAWSFG